MSITPQHSSGRHARPPVVSLSVRAGAVTHTGLVREHNEDSYLAADPVYLVADGMGGHREGAQASRTALAAFRSLLGTGAVDQDQLEQAVALAARQVDALGNGTSAPGSTLTGLVLSRQDDVPCVRVVNIGDSRTYCLRDRSLRQVTHDHSEVQEQVDAGLLTRDEARHSAVRNVITRALGAGVGPHVRADHSLVPVLAGDRFLICSDGLSTLVEDADIARVLHAQPDPQAAATTLVERALQAGGSDNVTVLVLDVLTAEPSWAGARSLERTIPTTVSVDHDDTTIPRPSLAAPPASTSGSDDE